MTHSSLDLFDRVPILEPIECSNTPKIYPTNSLNDCSLEFQFESDRNMMIDLQVTFLFLKVTLSKGNVASEAADDALFVSKTMHSLFSNCKVYFNNEQVYTSNGLYAQKAFISNEFSNTKGTKSLFAYVKVIGTRKNRHRLETNPSFLVKQRRMRKYASMGN